MKLRQIILPLLLYLLFIPNVKAETFHLVTAPFKPFTDPDHPKGGFLVEVARQALALRGHEIKVDFRPWARAMREAEAGRYNGLLSAFYNEERGKLFHFSAPLNTTKMVLVGLQGRIPHLNTYNTYRELRSYRIAIGRKWAYSEEFEKNKDLLKTIVNNEPAGIRMLFNNRVALFAVNIDQFYASIAELPEFNAADVKILEPPISKNDQHIAASRKLENSTKFLSEFNTGLAALKANGGYDKIRNGFFGF